MKGDFHIFYMAVKDFREGVNPYDKLYGQGFRYFYSPLFAVLLTPITFLKPLAAAWIWNGLNFFLLYRNWQLIMSYFNENVLFIKNRKRKLALLAFFYGLFGIYSNLHNHQMTIILLWGILEALRLVHCQKHLLAGALLALFINIKILPIVMIGYFIYRRELKLVSFTLIAFLAYLLLPALFIGFEENLALHTSWWELINPLNKEHNIDVSEKGLCSLTTLIPVLLMDSAQWDTNFDFKRNLFSLSADQAIMIMNICRAAIVLFVFYFLRSAPFQKSKSLLHQFWEISYILMATVLVFPHQQYYAFYFAFPAMVYLGYYVILSKNQLPTRQWWGLFIFLLLVTLAINSPYILGEWRRLFKYIKVPTYGFILLILPLSLITPKKIQKMVDLQR